MKIELYECPPIFDSLQYFECANQLAAKINADKKILEEYPTDENKKAFNKNLLVHHCLVAEGTVMNGIIAESNLKYQQYGWFIWLQTYIFTLGVPCKDNDEKFTYWFDKYFDRYFGSINFGGRYFVEAVNNYNSG